LVLCVDSYSFYCEAPPCEVQLNHPASPGQIEKLFSEMEVASGFPEIHLNNSGIYALPNNITMKEAEPIVQDLETVFDFYLRFFLYCTLLSISICLPMFLL